MKLLTSRLDALKKSKLAAASAKGTADALVITTKSAMDARSTRLTTKTYAKDDTLDKAIVDEAKKFTD